MHSMDKLVKIYNLNKNEKLHALIQSFEEQALSITEERKSSLEAMAQIISEELTSNQHLDIVIICTHNSRRSQVGELWIRTLVKYFSIENVHAFSGGTEATALHPNMAQAIITTGWKMLHENNQSSNPTYHISIAGEESQKMFSKKYDDAFNPEKDYLAILVCEEAAEACPIVIGAKHRFPLPYSDPKAFDDTEKQNEKYLECVSLIGTEFFYCFSKVKNHLSSNN